MVNFKTVETNNDFIANHDLWHALLPTASHHVAGSGGIAGNINIFEADTLLSEVLLGSFTIGASGSTEHDHTRLLAFNILLSHL